MREIRDLNGISQKKSHFIFFEIVEEQDMPKLKVNIIADGDTRMISFTGSIDEEFNFLPLNQNKGKIYKFDFNELKMINSCGIREWIRFVESLGSGVQIIYYNCPQIIVQQFNMVAGFLTANAKVATFYAPYFCEESDEEEAIILDATQIVNFKAPKKTTLVDGSEVELEFDAIEEQYFNFLKR